MASAQLKNHIGGIVDLIKPWEDELTSLNQRNRQFQLSFSMFENSLAELLNHAKTVLGEVNEAFTQSRRPVIGLLTETDCGNAEDPIHEAHDLHMALGRVKGQISRLSDMTSTNNKTDILGLIDQANNIIAHAKKTVRENTLNAKYPPQKNVEA